MKKHLTCAVALVVCFPFAAESELRYSDEQITEALETYSDDFQFMLQCAPFLFSSQSLSEVNFPITCVGKSISQFTVSFNGQAAEKLDAEAIVAHMKMRAKNDLGFLNQESLDYIAISQRVDAHYDSVIKAFFDNQGAYPYFSAESLSKLHLDCNVWTAGSGYPLALHIKCSLFSVAHSSIVGIQLTTLPIEQATLGYTAEAKLESYVKDAIESVIKDIATSWVTYEANTKEQLSEFSKIQDLFNEMP
ncbi:hypothetical protein J6J08_08345 [Pseudidiomarina sp. 1APR75-33.1]|uniref:hypothetical protein n=1 Tax=Pseudidiomarina terrestris TaxID=2820060 RepID=UPI00264FECE0|nr:hypothetical protein [Pseudidiomarina sp. 1APR75-33.1]MDN7127391.1 hypothetical protein [Pseudidiomarina sp. 1APR75-33.1]